MDDTGRRAAYREIAWSYLEQPGEAVLYSASLLSKEFVRDQMGAHEFVQLHFDVVDELLDGVEPAAHRSTVRSLAAVLLEAMMVYCDTNKKVAEVLAELRDNYQALDRSKCELERSRDELRQTTAQLIQSEKLTALGELAANVVHEVNQPLNAVRLICEDMLRDLARDRLGQDDLVTGLREVVAEVRRLAEIADHLRRFSRPTTGLRREKVDLAAVARSILSFLALDLRLRGVEVAADLTPGSFVQGDPVRLEQVLMNLVANARDAVTGVASPAEMRIAVRVFGEPSEPTGRVVVEVIDSGVGIPAALRTEIFEPFVTTKEGGRGTGLGLSVVRRIVTEHRGTIEVDSAEGAGARFRVVLPASAAEELP